MVCWQDSHGGGRVPRSNNAYAERNRRGSVALYRFCQNIVFWMIRKCFADCGFLFLICQDQNVFSRDQSIQPMDSLLEERAVAEKAQKLLRGGSSAQRPKTLPATSCQN